MFDTQNYDLIVSNSLIKPINEMITEKKIEVLCTHIQNDELQDIPDEKKRALVSQIIRKQVPTVGGVYGVSKYGCGTYGDGSVNGISIDQMRSSAKKHTKDALIATTAAKYADVLVTEDKRFTNRFREICSSCEVWSFDQFKINILNKKK